MTENQKDYGAYYQQTKQRQFMLNLNREYDAEIIDWLESHRPYATYIRNLIMADMRENGIDIRRKDARMTNGEYIDWRRTHRKRSD